MSVFLKFYTHARVRPAGPGLITPGATDGERVRALLGRLHTVARHEAVSDEAAEFANKFVGKVEKVFANLPRPIDWLSFYKNDLALATIPDDVTGMLVGRYDPAPAPGPVTR
jgi:hypothetical protein